MGYYGREYWTHEVSRFSQLRVVLGDAVLDIRQTFLGLNEPMMQRLLTAYGQRHGDAAAAIANAAIANAELGERDELCAEAVDWFVRLYGAEAGNLALKVMSRGGVYLGGGIAPKILPRLRNGAFLDAFFNKGRMRPLLEAMPVKVILNDRAALYGAALYVSPALQVLKV